MKLLVCGDTHGNNAWWARLVNYAAKGQVDAIMQVGDFGYWEHQREGREFLERTSKKAVQAGITIYWIDGNHENHPLLWQKYPPGKDGFCEIRERLVYVPRGHSWTWGGKKMLALGGAYSVDQDWRKDAEKQWNQPGTLWWPTELITSEDVEKAERAGKVDILFSHDCPWGVDLPGIGGDFPVSDLNRQALRKVVNTTLPNRVYTGHYHMRVSGKIDIPYQDKGGDLSWHHVQVETLAHDGAWDHTAWEIITI